MKGSHEFNPKEASTFVGDDSPSFYNQRHHMDDGNYRMIDTIYRQPNVSNLEETQPSEMPLLQN